MADTAGCQSVKTFATTGWRMSARRYSRQYDRHVGPARASARQRVSTRDSLAGDRRAVTPAVSKSLEAGVVVLFVALVTAVLLGGVVPDYQRAADARVGDRVLAAASAEVESAVPAAVGARTVDRSHRADLPARIGGRQYRIRVDGRDLVLDHPDRAVSGRSRLVLPSRVDRVEGSWESGGPTVVAVHGGPDGLVVELTGGDG